MQRFSRLPRCSRPLRLCVWTLIPFLTAGAAPAQTPLHQRIDQAIATGTSNFGKFAAPLASDAEFVRRLYLDLTGVIPSAAEARAFLNDPAPDRRAKLIDRLLASPAHARHLQTVFDVLLMDRRADKHVPRPQWPAVLRT